MPRVGIGSGIVGIGKAQLDWRRGSPAHVTLLRASSNQTPHIMAISSSLMLDTSLLILFAGFMMALLWQLAVLPLERRRWKLHRAAVLASYLAAAYAAFRAPDLLMLYAAPHPAPLTPAGSEWVPVTAASSGLMVTPEGLPAWMAMRCLLAALAASLVYSWRRR